MAKTNYSYEKRSKELERQKKKEEKRKKKQAQKSDGIEDETIKDSDESSTSEE